MADTAFGPDKPDPSGLMEARVAVLEEIAKATKEALGDIRAELRALRSDIGDMRRETKADFRWLLSLILAGYGSLLGLMAHGFHWL